MFCIKMWYAESHHVGFTGRQCEIEPQRSHSKDLRGICTCDRWNQMSTVEIICFKLRLWTEFRALNQYLPCWVMSSYRRAFTTKTKLFIQISECQSVNYGCKRKSFVSVTSLVNANLTKVWMSSCCSQKFCDMRRATISPAHGALGTPFRHRQKVWMKNLPSDDGRQVSNLQDIYFKKQSHGYHKTTEEKRDVQWTHTGTFS